MHNPQAQGQNKTQSTTRTTKQHANTTKENMDYIRISQPPHQKVTYLFKHTNIQIAYRATNTIFKPKNNEVHVT
jgi:hypothetical protein